MPIFFFAMIRTLVLSYEEYERIQQFQNETGIQVLYPMVEKTTLAVQCVGSVEHADIFFRNGRNIWRVICVNNIFIIYRII